LSGHRLTVTDRDDGGGANDDNCGDESASFSLITATQTQNSTSSTKCIITFRLLHNTQRNIVIFYQEFLSLLSLGKNGR